jgi:hypothetical protein
MKNVALKLLPGLSDATSGRSTATPRHPTIGRIVGLDPAKIPLVDFPGNAHGPTPARLALPSADADLLVRHWEQVEVLLVFVDDEISRPVITGLVRESLNDPSYVADWDGFRRLLLKAEEELVLQCGDARIVLRRDGKLTIIGKEILSRARQRHRIRGATVDIN